MDFNQTYLVSKDEIPDHKIFIKVPIASSTDPSNPTVLKLIEQGGTIASLILVCLLVWLLTKLIRAAKED
jgi:hypothetical protein